MHEASLAGGLLRMVQQIQQQQGFKRVTQLRLAVGQLAGIDVHALRFALQALQPHSCMEGARIDITEPVGTAWCDNCRRHVPLASRGQPCATCNDYRLTPSAGTDLRLIDLRVVD